MQPKHNHKGSVYGTFCDFCGIFIFIDYCSSFKVTKKHSFSEVTSYFTDLQADADYNYSG